jgi:hypothetical protein
MSSEAKDKVEDTRTQEEKDKDDRIMTIAELTQDLDEALATIPSGLDVGGDVIPEMTGYKFDFAVLLLTEMTKRAKKLKKILKRFVKFAEGKDGRFSKEFEEYKRERIADAQLIRDFSGSMVRPSGFGVSSASIPFGSTPSVFGASAPIVQGFGSAPTIQQEQPRRKRNRKRNRNHWADPLGLHSGIALARGGILGQRRKF